MPIKRVQFPDGSVKRIEVPEGASNEQIIAFVQSQQAPKADFSNVQGRVTQPPQGPQGLKQQLHDYPLGISGELMDTIEGAGHGLKQAGLGVAQFLSEGALAAPFMRAQEALRPTSTQDLVAGHRVTQNPALRASEAIGRYAKSSRQEFEASPVGQTAFGKGGSMLGQYGPGMLIPGGSAKTVLGKIGMGAIEGAGQGAIQPVEQGQSRGGNMGAGAAGGAILAPVGAAFTRAAKGASDTLSEPLKAVARKARELGVQLTPVQLSANRLLKTIADQGARLPFSGARKFSDQQQRSFNSAVADALGEKSDTITREVFNNARQRIGNDFNTLSARNSLPVTPELVSSLRAIQRDAIESGDDDVIKAVNAQIGALVNRAEDSVIPGAAYKSFDSKLGKLTAGGGTKGHFLGQVREAVQNAMDDAISPADQAAWRKAREQWAVLKTIEPAVAKDALGNISPPQLLGLVTNNAAAKARMARGGGKQLGALADAGQRMKAAPDSGSADRLAINLGATGSLGGLAAFSPTAATTGMAALGTNRLAQRLLNSPAAGRYMVEGAGRGAAPLNALAALARGAGAPAALESKKSKDKK